MKHFLSGVMTLLLVIIGLPSVHAQTDTVITECDYQHVSKVVAVGGSIILDCDRNIQIWADKPLTIMVDTTIKAAEGRTVSFEALKGRAFVINKDNTLTLSDMTLKGNPNERGGGIENNGGKLFISKVIFSNNDSSPGAAIHNVEGGSVTIEDSSFSGNQSFGGGGAIYNDAKAEITIRDSSFIKNISYDQSNGGAVYNLGTLTITGSTFSQNEAQGRFAWGGAIFTTGTGVLTVTNSTFSENTATHSGSAISAIQIFDSEKTQTTIQFSTFIGNRTNRWLGALSVEGGTITVSNSLFSNNTANGKPSDCEYSTSTNKGVIVADNNLSDAGCGYTAATGVATLSDNGGLTQTVAIASGSNAIDTASECPTNAVDQRGTVRPQGKSCDVGAYEFVELTTAATTVGICQVTTTRDVRLREEPNTAGSVLAVVPHNSTFQAIEQVTGWYHITYGVANGWVSAEFVTAKGTCGG